PRTEANAATPADRRKGSRPGGRNSRGVPRRGFMRRIFVHRILAQPHAEVGGGLDPSLRTKRVRAVARSDSPDAHDQPGQRLTPPVAGCGAARQAFVAMLTI